MSFLFKVQTLRGKLDGKKQENVNLLFHWVEYYYYYYFLITVSCCCPPYISHSCCRITLRTCTTKREKRKEERTGKRGEPQSLHVFTILLVFLFLLEPI